MDEGRRFLIVGIVIALLIGAGAAFFAAGGPDGLESAALFVQGQKTLTGPPPAGVVIQDDIAGKTQYRAPMQDYSLGLLKGPLGGIIPIIAGILLVFLAVFGATRVVKRLSNRKENTQDQKP